MAPDAHRLEQTAFRLPEDVRDWLRDTAAAEGRPMTAIVIDALEGYRKAANSTGPAQGACSGPITGPNKTA